MAIRKIVTMGDEVLRKKSRPVVNFNEKLWQLLDDMKDTMNKAEGVGLAAVQVGVLRRVIVIDVGDGLMELINGEPVLYSRYYAYKHFSQFIKEGMTRVTVMDSLEDESKIASTAFKGDGETVLILVNNAEESKDIRLCGFYDSMNVYRTDAQTNCEKIYSGEFTKNITLSGKSITTIVMEKNK